MKVIICYAIGDISIYSPGQNKWNVCECGNSAARWDDPEAGHLAVAAKDPARPYVRGLGLSNALLLPLLATRGLTWEDLRNWHDIATSAPDYVFDKTRAGCWAVPFIVGSTADTRWASDEETADALGTRPGGEAGRE